MEKSSWRKSPQTEPFLAPLSSDGRRRRRSEIFIQDLPPAAAPIAVTLVGAVAMFFLFRAFAGDVVIVEATPAPPPQAEITTTATENVADPQVGAVQVAEPDAAIETAIQLQVADPRETGSILQAVPSETVFMPAVPIAETEDEIEQLERMQLEEKGDVEAPQPIGAAGFRAATASQSVNMRAGPSDEAEVLAIVPARAEIEAETDRASWCAVSFDGRRGYIYKSFVDYR